MWTATITNCNSIQYQISKAVVANDTTLKSPHTRSNSRSTKANTDAYVYGCYCSANCMCVEIKCEQTIQRVIGIRAPMHSIVSISIRMATTRSVGTGHRLCVFVKAINVKWFQRRPLEPWNIGMCECHGHPRELNTTWGASKWLDNGESNEKLKLQLFKFSSIGKINRKLYLKSVIHRFAPDAQSVRHQFQLIYSFVNMCFGICGKCEKRHSREVALSH